VVQRIVGLAVALAPVVLAFVAIGMVLAAGHKWS
jgi:hypothetical protein